MESLAACPGGGRPAGYRHPPAHLQPERKKKRDLVRKLLGSHFRTDEVPAYGLALPESTTGEHRYQACLPSRAGPAYRRADGLPNFAFSPLSDAYHPEQPLCHSCVVRGFLPKST